MIDNGYNKTHANRYVLVKKFDRGDFLILLLYVDDMLIVTRDHIKVRVWKKALSRLFLMKDMDPIKQVLGIHIV